MVASTRSSAPARSCPTSRSPSSPASSPRATRCAPCAPTAKRCGVA